MVCLNFRIKFRGGTGIDRIGIPISILLPIRILFLISILFQSISELKIKNFSSSNWIFLVQLYMDHNEPNTIFKHFRHEMNDFARHGLRPIF